MAIKDSDYRITINADVQGENAIKELKNLVNGLNRADLGNITKEFNQLENVLKRLSDRNLKNSLGGMLNSVFKGNATKDELTKMLTQLNKLNKLSIDSNGISSGIRNIAGALTELSAVKTNPQVISTLQALGNVRLANFTNTAGQIRKATSKANPTISQQIKGAPASLLKTGTGAVDFIGLSVSAFGGYYMAQKLIGDIYSKTKALENLELSFKFINEGDLKAAREDMDYLYQLGNAIGVSVPEIAPEFQKWKTALKGARVESETIYKSFTNAAQAFSAGGLSVEKQKLAFNALTQMASKGQVMMEELKGQLGDALPGATQRMAKSLGVPQEKLFKMVESGKLGIKEVIQFTNILGEEVAKAGVDVGSRLEAKAARVSNAWFKFTDWMRTDQGASNFFGTILELADKFITYSLPQIVIGVREGSKQINKMLGEDSPEFIKTAWHGLGEILQLDFKTVAISMAYSIKLAFLDAKKYIADMNLSNLQQANSGSILGKIKVVASKVTGLMPWGADEDNTKLRSDSLARQRQATADDFTDMLMEFKKAMAKAEEERKKMADKYKGKSETKGLPSGVANKTGSDKNSAYNLAKQEANSAFEAKKTVLKAQHEYELAVQKSLLEEKAISEKDFAQQKYRITIDEINLERQAKQEQIDTLSSKISEFTPEQREAAKANIKKMQAEIKAMDYKAVELTVELQADFKKLDMQVANHLIQLEVEILAKQGKTYDSNILDIESKRKEALKGATPEEASKINQSFDLDAQKAKYDKFANDIELSKAEQASYEAALALSVEKGAMTQIQANELVADSAKNMARIQQAKVSEMMDLTSDPAELEKMRKEWLELEKVATQIDPVISQVADNIAQGFVDAAQTIMETGGTLGEFFESLAISILKIWQKMAADLLKEQSAMQLKGLLGGSVSASSGGFDFVGLIKNFLGGKADGGRIYGAGTDTSDSNLALLSRNEFVIKAKSARAVGYDKLHYLNATGQIPRFANGGGLGVNVGNGSNTTVVNPTIVLDPAHVRDAIAGSSFDDMVVSAVSRRAGKLRPVLR